MKRGIPHPETRKVERPSYEQLLKDLQSMSFLAVGRMYGVSDNAVRKWLRWYEAAAARENEGPREGMPRLRDPPPQAAWTATPSPTILV